MLDKYIQMNGLYYRYTLLCKTNPLQVRVEDGFAFFVVLFTDRQFPKSTVSDN